jgi:membrane protease YdiL (CAAX protease family)
MYLAQHQSPLRTPHALLASKEILFRGFLQTALTRAMPTPAAVALTAAAFPIMLGSDRFVFLAEFATSAVRGASFALTGNLAVPIAASVAFDGLMAWTEIIVGLMKASEQRAPLWLDK